MLSIEPTGSSHALPLLPGPGAAPEAPERFCLKAAAVSGGLAAAMGLLARQRKRVARKAQAVGTVGGGD